MAYRSGRKKVAEQDHESFQGSDDEMYEGVREGKRRLADVPTDVLKALEGNRGFRAIDGWIGTILMICVIVYIVVLMGSHIFQVIWRLTTYKQIYSMDVIRFLNDFTLCVALFLVVIVWHTLCFNNSHIKGLWSSKAVESLIGSIMAGGFIPRPAAAGMGLLLFLNNNLVVSMIWNGKSLLNKGWYHKYMYKYDSCFANSIEEDVLNWGVPRQWFQRVTRDQAYGCFGVASLGEIADAHEMGLPSWSTRWGVGQRRTFVSMGNITTKQSKNALLVPKLVHPVINGTADTTKYCTYDCGGFKAVALSTIIMSAGGIFAGAAVITKAADKMSARVGWYLVTSKSSPDQLVHAVLGVDMPDEMPDTARERNTMVSELQNIHVRHPGSPTVAAIILIAIVILCDRLAPTIAVDGYFTVDYYTTLLMMISVSISCMLRFTSPFNLRSIIYTEGMWANGKDTFQVWNEASKSYVDKELTLYDWLHTPNKDRKKLLFNYCRAIRSDDLKDLYNNKGFISELPEDKEEPTETIQNTGMTDCVFAVIAKISTCLAYVFHPWRLCFTCGKTSDAEADEEKEKLRVITKCEVKCTRHKETWEGVVCDKQFENIIVDLGVKGIIQKLGDEDNTVVVDFDMDGRDPSEGDVNIAYYVDKAGGKMSPVPRSAMSADGAVWSFQVPLSSLSEATPEWSFTRKLLGETSLKNSM